MRITLWIDDRLQRDFVSFCKKYHRTYGEVARKAIIGYLKTDDSFKRAMELEEKERQKHFLDRLIKFTLASLYFNKNALKNIAKAIPFVVRKKELFELINLFKEMAADVYKNPIVYANLCYMEEELRKKEVFEENKDRLIDLFDNMEDAISSRGRGLLKSSNIDLDI